MSVLRRLLMAGCCLTPVIAIPAAAQSQFQDLGMLDAVIATSLGADVGQPGGAVHPLDRRLRLTQCNQDVVVSEPQNGAVIVACGSSGWRLRVALVQSANTSVTGGEAGSDVPLIRRGDEVQLVVVGTGFTVSTRAISDQTGRAGDRVRVRLPDRSAPLYGTVMPDGRVRL